jgi:integrase
MATISFIVKSEKKKQPATIYLRFRDGRETDIIIPTPEKVFPEYWSNKTQSFKQRILYSEIFTEKKKVTIEENFSRLRDFILSGQFNLKGSRPSKDWLKSIIDKFYNKKEPGAETLSQYLQRYIDEANNGTRLTSNSFNKKVFSIGTVKSIKVFQSVFNEYQGIYTEKKIKELKEKNEPQRPLKIVNFDGITIDFYNDFIKFMYEKKFSPNTIGKHIKTLKVIMRQSREEGLHNNNEFERKGFKSLREPVQNIYLTESELNKIFELDLSYDSTLQIARDIFLIGCYTAQRFSDYSRITTGNIRTLENGKMVIDLIQQKTGEKVIIPVRHELNVILKRYDYKLPKTYEQKINRHIKTIGEKAGITEIVRVEENRGGMTVKRDVKKYELIVTHTARRSGCTNMYLAGIPGIDIMKISGHKTESEFLKYIKVSKEETALSLSNHPYFIGNTLKIAE